MTTLNSLQKKTEQLDHTKRKKLNMSVRKTADVLSKLQYYIYTFVFEIFLFLPFG